MAKRRADDVSDGLFHSPGGSAVAGSQEGLIVADLISQAAQAITKAAGGDGVEVRRSIREISARIFKQPQGLPIRAEAACLSSDLGVSQWRVEFKEAAGRIVAEVSALLEGGRGDEPRATSEGGAAKPDVAVGLGRPARDAEKRLRSSGTKSVAQGRRIEQIMRGAYQVIAQKGFSAATTREIAEAAGMPIPTMYQYIRSKDELLPMIFNQLAGDLGAEFDRSFSESEDLVRTLSFSILRYFEYCENNRKTINLIYRETANVKKSEREKIFRMDQSFVDVWEKILESGKSNGQFNIDDPRITAELIYFLCTIWALRYWSLRAYSGEVVLRAIRQFVLRGVGVFDEAADRSIEKTGKE